MSSQNSNAAIFFHGDAYNTDRKNLMGRHTAGEGFLEGFAQHGDVDSFWGYVGDKRATREFTAQIKHHRPDATLNFISQEHPKWLQKPGALHLPGPALENEAWRRRVWRSQQKYSLCGLTHTTASKTAQRAIRELVLSPVQPWDCLICTSQSVLRTVSDMVNMEKEYLADRFGAKEITLPQFAVIPLGVNVDKIKRDDASRHKWRAELGIGPDDSVALFVGRLSFHAKAHPFPMFIALEEVARALGRPVHLVQAGWFANPMIEGAFKAEAARLCPSVKVHTVDARLDPARFEIWSVADVFISLSDNIQETFGLTPIEAMAAGLPVITTDWDGYRDTVVDGEVGFRIPTTMPSPGSAGDLADRHVSGLDDYDVYCGRTSLITSVDIRATIAALSTLFSKPDLRQEMGAKGRMRAESVYDWKHIVRQYQAVWRELATLRAAGNESARPRKNRPGYPGFMDPTIAFRSYPSRNLVVSDWIQKSTFAPDTTPWAVVSSKMVQISPIDRYSEDLVKKIWDCIDDLDAIRLKDVYERLQGFDRVLVDRHVLLLDKSGYVVTTPDNGT